jgi:translation initiation factor 1
MERKRRVPTDGGERLQHNPFANLNDAGLPPGPADSTDPSTPSSATGQAPASPARSKNQNRGRVDILRQTAHRGGKTVTVVTGFKGIGLPEKERLAKAIQQACGTGGTVKDGHIEIQGDRRDIAARILTEAGFRPVFAGG